MNILKYSDFITENADITTIPKIMGIRDLAKLIANTMGGEEEIYQEMIAKSFKSKGDDGVIDIFYKMTDLHLEPIIKGKYRLIGF